MNSVSEDAGSVGINLETSSREDAMRAVVYSGPRDVAVKEVPEAQIESPTDVLVQITSSNICGSDLHMYEGRTDFPAGGVFGHENLGQVAEVGNAVERVKVGDRHAA
jgi:glutathione-independent formaldehyde dehydrogenase